MMPRTDPTFGSAGMGGHQSARMKTDEWLTPREILDALGPFDLDPCAPRVRPWPMATKHYTIDDNGLYLDWFGRVWCNPPYGRETGMWLKRCEQHGNAIALVFARTETGFFFEHVWGGGHGGPLPAWPTEFLRRPRQPFGIQQRRTIMFGGVRQRRLRNSARRAFRRGSIRRQAAAIEGGVK